MTWQIKYATGNIMVSLAKQRIKRVFDNSLENVRKGKRANISNNMLKQGYSKSSSRALKVKKTKTWKNLLTSIDDEEILDMLKEIMRDKSDKRSRIEAGKELFKLKDRYPAGKLKIQDFNEELEELQEH